MSSLMRTIRRKMERETTGANKHYGRSSKMPNWKKKEIARQMKREQKAIAKNLRQERKSVKTSIHKKV